MKIKSRDAHIEVDDLTVLKQCIECPNSVICAKELQNGEVACYSLYRLVTEPGITIDQIIQGMIDEEIE